MGNADVVIGGAGIIGLSAALELARNGFRVRVLERGRAMAEASWAAAGMLAADDPENPPELAPLASLSRALYPEFLNTVRSLSGRAVPLRTRNALQASQPRGCLPGGETSFRTPMAAEEAQRRIPGLRAGTRSLLWLEEASLDPRDLCIALPLAAAASGVVLDQGTEVLAVEGQANSVRIRTSAGELSAGVFVNCCGAWASGVHHPGPVGPQAIEPRKGQIATVRLPEGDQQAPRLQYVLRSPTVYLVPRGDGRIVIGASVEQVGFDREVKPATIDKLLAEAADLWPPITSSRVVESWVGLRPGTADGLPLIGRSDASNRWWAAGHFRNGILLAPATAFILRQLLEGGSPAVELDAFFPGRFLAAQEAAAGPRSSKA